MLVPLHCRRLMEHVTSAQVADLVRIHESIVRSPDRYLELNGDFHQVLEEAAAAPRISAMLNTLRDTSALMLSRTVAEPPAPGAGGDREHARIIEAITERDLQKWIDVTCHHNQADLGPGARGRCSPSRCPPRTASRQAVPGCGLRRGSGTVSRGRRAGRSPRGGRSPAR